MRQQPSSDRAPIIVRRKVLTGSAKEGKPQKFHFRTSIDIGPAFEPSGHEFRVKGAGAAGGLKEVQNH